MEDKIYDDFKDLMLDKKDVIQHANAFKLEQLKITHYYSMLDEINAGSPIKTSLEITSDYYPKTNSSVWNKKVTHTYYSIDGSIDEEIDSYKEEIENSNKLLIELEKIDLRYLLNNYFIDEFLNNLSHWEIEYNYKFKIVGTYNQEIEAFKEIKSILNFNEVIDQECKKVKSKMDIKI